MNEQVHELAVHRNTFQQIFRFLTHSLSPFPKKAQCTRCPNPAALLEENKQQRQSQLFLVLKARKQN